MPLPVSLTTTVWTMLDGSRVFPARYAGTCLVSGLPFVAGTEVRMAEVGGCMGAVTQSGLRLLDCRTGADTSEVRSSFTLVTPLVDTDALVAQATRMTLMNRQGVKVEARYECGAWWANHSSRRTDKQMLAHARKAFAIAAERVEGVR
jgi:hypothetical protein